MEAVRCLSVRKKWKTAGGEVFSYNGIKASKYGSSPLLSRDTLESYFYVFFKSIYTCYSIHIRIFSEKVASFEN